MPADLSRILLTGGSGQVGRALRLTLPSSSAVLAPDRQSMDLAKPDSIRRAIRDFRPTLIINAAAYTAVDRAESEADLAMAINGLAPGVLAEEAHRAGATLLHYSTDYVFDGTKQGPYTETDAPNPLNAYGRTKLAGEQAVRNNCLAHYILRTSWVYAADGVNFLNTMLRLGHERYELRIVDDQVGAPTWATAIAEMTLDLLSQVTSREDPCYGLYHCAAAGSVSWFGFAQAIFEDAAERLCIPPPRLIPIVSAEYSTVANRPVNSRMDTSRLQQTFGINPRPWREMLRRCLDEKILKSGPNF